MAVIRQQRTTRIGPIGVARTGGGSDAVGNAIRNAANQIRERYYTIAANEAEDRGRERAAEVNLQSITTLDSNTMMPQALSVASGMGTIQKEAFEKAILLRFEGAITDDIRSKQAELMQRVATERNAPKLFEELFTEYLDQTGANASGYYKQIITDQGASSLEDGRSRLKVAQIARIQAEAKAAKARSDDAFVKNARDQGLSGQPFEFESTSNRITAEGTTYKGVGVTDDSTEGELHRRARLAYVNGALDRILNDKAVAPYASRIQQYFASGGQFYLMKGLPPAVRSAMREIKNITGADDPALYQEIAQQNSSVFSSAQESGSYVIADAQAEAERTEAERQAYVDQSNQDTDAFLLKIEQSLVDNDYEIFARSGSISQIQDAIKNLDNQSSALYALPINTERRKKLIAEVDKAKDQLAGGLVLRTLQLNPKMAVEFANAIEKRSFGELVDIMPSLQFNQFAGLLDAQNAESLAQIAYNWAKGEKRDIDRAVTEQTLKIAKYKRMFSEDVKNNDLERMRDAIIDLRRVESNFKNVPIKYQNMMTEFESQYNSMVNADKKAQFNVDAEALVNNTDSESIEANLKELYNSAKNLNGDPEVVLDSVQKMMNIAAADAVNDYLMDQFDVSQKSAEQLKYMSLYAETGERVTGLLPDSQKFVDMVLGRGETVYGQQVKAQGSYLAEQLNDLSGSMTETLNKSKQETARVQFKFNILNGQAIQNPESSDVQAAAQQVMADAVGLNEFPPDLYTMSLDEVAQRPELAALLAMSKDTKVVTSAFVSTSDKFLRDGLTPEEIPEFMRNVRELVLTDSRGRIGLNDSARAALGAERATQLQVMYTAYNVAPIGSEGAFMSRVLERLNDPLTNDEFTRITGYRDRATLLLEADVPRNLWDEYAPVVDALGVMRGKNAAADMKKYIDARLHENNNAYDLFTGSSAVSFDIEAMHGNVKAVDLGIQKIVAEFSTEQEPLNYEVQSKVSVDDISAAVADDGFIISASSVSDALTQLRVRKRVVYGPRPDFSLSNPVMQLYKVDQFGMVSVIDGSSFNIMTDTRILEEVRKAATVIKSDPTKLQTIEELGGNVEEFVGQYLTGTAAANPLQITVDGQ